MSACEKEEDLVPLLLCLVLLLSYGQIFHHVFSLESYNFT